MAVPPPLTSVERIILVVLLFAFIGPLFGTIVLVLLNTPMVVRSPAGLISTFPLLLAGGYLFGLIPATLTGLTLGALDVVQPRAHRNALQCASVGSAWLVGLTVLAFGLPSAPRETMSAGFPGSWMGPLAELALWGGLSAVLTNWVVARILPPPAQRTRRPPRDPDRAAPRSIPVPPNLAGQA